MKWQARDDSVWYLPLFFFAASRFTLISSVASSFTKQPFANGYFRDNSFLNSTFLSLYFPLRKHFGFKVHYTSFEVVKLSAFIAYSE